MSTSWSNEVQRAVTRISTNDRGVGVRTAAPSMASARPAAFLGLDTTYAHLARTRSTSVTTPANPTNTQLTDRQTLTLRILQDIFGMPGPETTSSTRLPNVRTPPVPRPAELPDLGNILRGWARTLAGDGTGDSAQE